MRWKQLFFYGMICTGVLLTTLSLGKQMWVLSKEQNIFERLKCQIRDIQNESDDLDDREEAMGEMDKEPVSIIDENNKNGKSMLPEYKAIYQENQDFCGWITIEGTKIDYPVMQKLEDREYYLHRDFYGKESYGGVPFIGNGDVRCDEGDLFIYGHNMKNGTMFAGLQNYRKKEYWEEHSVIYFDTLWEHREYEIFAVFYASEDDWIKEDGLLYSAINGTNVNRGKMLERLRNIGLFKSEDIPDPDMPCLFLITCSYREKRERLVVAGTWKIS